MAFTLAKIAKKITPTAELIIITGTPTNQTNAEIEIEPLTTDTEIRNCSK